MHEGRKKLGIHKNLQTGGPSEGTEYLASIEDNTS